MDFPYQLWQDPDDQRLVRDAIALFTGQPLIVTDEIANSVYLNAEAENLYQESAGALVNRLSFSLLGFGNRAGAPPALVNALLGDGPSWSGAVDLSGENEPPRWHFVQASAVKRSERFVSGLVRLSSQPAPNRSEA